MKIWNRMWIEDDGVLSFEWVLLVTLLTIGIVGGVSRCVTRSLMNWAMWPKACWLSISRTRSAMPRISRYTRPRVSGGLSDSSFIDAASFQDCSRVANPPPGQAAEDDANPKISLMASQRSFQNTFFDLRKHHEQSLAQDLDGRRRHAVV